MDDECDDANGSTNDRLGSYSCEYDMEGRRERDGRGRRRQIPFLIASPNNISNLPLLLLVRASASRAKSAFTRAVKY